MTQTEFDDLLDRLCQEADKILDILRQEYDLEPDCEVLRDLLFNAGFETKKKILEPLRTMYRSLGEENEAIWFDTIAKHVELLNTVTSAFRGLDFKLAFILTIEKGKVKIKNH